MTSGTMNAITLVALCLGCLLLSQGSLSQIIFQDGGLTTPSYTTYTTVNPNFFNGGNNYYNYSPYIVNNNPSASCYCVSFRRCSSLGGPTSPDGSGTIDIRIVNTVTGTTTGSVTAIATLASSGINAVVVPQSYCQYNLDLCCPSIPYSCGIRSSPYPNAPTSTGNQAPFGAYPWQAIILTTSNVYVGSGVLIDHMHILTVAHKVASYQSNPSQLKIRMGDWDASNTNEPIPYQEYNVGRMFINPSYNPSTLSNSIAILRLSSSVQLGQLPTITTGCLSSTQITGLRCWVSGWGASAFQSGVSGNSIQTQVDVPLVDQTTCQNTLRTTKLGSNFILDTNSFMCAGGETGKDACTGDGGSPLVCPIAGKWYVVGLVAWGVGCGTTNIPGVYINVTNYISWIQTTTNTY